MTQSQTLSVEGQELLDRATEIEAPIPAVPTEVLAAPCALPNVLDGHGILVYGNDAILRRLTQFQNERSKLATSLRNAAKAYEEVDEGAAESIDGAAAAIDGGGSGSSPSAASVDGDSMSAFCDPDPDEIYYPPPPPPRPELPYYEVRQASLDIEQPDQGASLQRFAQQWTAQKQALLNATSRFRSFQYWEGLTATQVEANFETYTSWMVTLATQCGVLVSAATDLRTAHVTYKPQHPTYATIKQYDDAWNELCTRPDFNTNIKPALITKYEYWQAESTKVLNDYYGRARLPLTPISTQAPPGAAKIDPPPPPPDPTEPEPAEPDDPDGEIPGGGEGEIPGGGGDEIPTYPTTPSTGTGTGAAGTPSLPPTGMDGLSGEDLKDALSGMPGLPLGEPTLKPASVGGGGGVPGMPSMPMQPPVGSEGAAAGAGAGGRDLASLGRGVGGGPGAGAGGPMGGGMAPMAPGGGQQGKNSEGKRGPGEDDALYTEERSWTEAVIGNRRRKDAPDTKQ